MASRSFASSRSRRWLAALLAGLWLPLAQADEPAEIRALLARGENAAALQRAQKAMASQPRDAQARFLYGVVLMETGRDAEALAHFTQMAQDFPELPDPLNNIALIHARNARPELALEALQAALRNDPTHRTARANLGQVHLMLAAQALQQAADGSPADPPLLRRLEAVRALLAAPAR